VSVITAGVDLASQALRTASCEISWSGGVAEVRELTASGVGDEEILELVGRADKTGLDVPLGWPVAFVDAVSAHHELRAWTGGTQRALRYRVTDHHVWDATGRWPLSVSSDLIGVPALRAAALLSRLPDRAERSGAGSVVEVYPAAALRRWGFDGQGYKRKAGADVRRTLVPSFKRRTERWLCLSEAQWRTCEVSDDAFDALLAGLVARASSAGRCDPVPAGLHGLAAREGWIAVPFADSLDELART
jgi:predicted nuclease with RNAse H fold